MVRAAHSCVGFPIDSSYDALFLLSGWSPLHSSRIMTVLSFAIYALLSCVSNVAAAAATCPECELGMSMPPPRIITTTEPCCECGECEEPTTQPVVTMTEPCCECGECDSDITTQPVFISTLSVCASSSRSSIIPYTSGSSTFYFSSCVPSTLWYMPSVTTAWYTPNATAPTCTPQTSIITRTTTVGSGLQQVTTLVTTALSTIYVNGTAPSAHSVMSTAIFTVYESGTLLPAQTIVSTAYSTIYEISTPPPAQTMTTTSISTAVSTIYESGTPPPAQTETTVSTVYSYISGTASPAQTITVTSVQAYTTDLCFTSDILTTLPAITVTGSTTIISTTTEVRTGQDSDCSRLWHDTDQLPVTSTIVQTEIDTATSTNDITFTSQPETSYATVTVGTQTIVSTLSVATGKLRALLYDDRALTSLLSYEHPSAIDCYFDIAPVDTSCHFYPSGKHPDGQ
jgi:hypothetical protein